MPFNSNMNTQNMEKNKKEMSPVDWYMTVGMITMIMIFLAQVTRGIILQIWE